MNSGIVDTGTSVLVGTTSVVNKLKAAAGLPLVGNEIDCSKINTYPPIIFMIDDTEYSLDPSDYIIEITMSG